MIKKSHLYGFKMASTNLKAVPRVPLYPSNSMALYTYVVTTTYKSCL